MAGSFIDRARGGWEPSGGSSEQPWQGAARSRSRLRTQPPGASHWENARAGWVLNSACEAVCTGSGMASPHIQWQRACKRFQVESRAVNSIPALLALAWWLNYRVAIRLPFVCAFRPNYSGFPCCVGFDVPGALGNACPRALPRDLHSPEEAFWFSLESSWSNRVPKMCSSASSYFKCKQQCATVLNHKPKSFHTFYVCSKNALQINTYSGIWREAIFCLDVQQG